MAIFTPQPDTPLKDSYLILNAYEEFNNLSDKEMRLGYYYACKDSPYVLLSDEDKIDRILKIKELAFTTSERERFSTLNFSDELIASFNVWASFIPDLREKGKRILDSILKNCETVAMQDVNMYLQTDMVSAKSFMSANLDIAKQLPEIIRCTEQGFGVVAKKKKEDSKRETDFEQA